MGSSGSTPRCNIYYEELKKDNRLYTTYTRTITDMSTGGIRKYIEVRCNSCDKPIGSHAREPNTNSTK